MKSLLPLNALFSLMLFGSASSSFAHDDAGGREKEFSYGYRAGYIAAVREVGEGTAMCTRSVSLLEVIQVIGAHSKSKGITPESALTAKHITEALAAKYPCPKR
ncbi:hypothetical protein GCM10027046_33450 [Uliginosibacterium flavum]|uniref:Rap1a immunity protein domain-containing protein n=1 Tax=Uliginosibacterium flavum TaxID=1396831 RepID=A0ABV2TPB6_9RHOO